MSCSRRGCDRYGDLNGADPSAVRVELSAAAADGSAPVRRQMNRAREPTGALGGHVFGAAVSAARPPSDCTARAVPRCDGVAIPLEDARMLWPR